MGLQNLTASLAGLPGVKQLRDRFVGPVDVLGVDVGNYAIKCAWIKADGGSLRLKAWGHMPLDVKPDATLEQKKAQTINALKAFLIEKGVPIREAATAVSGNSVIVRYVKFPKLTRAELQSTLATEAEPFIPFDINEVQLGFHILADIVEEGQKKMETVLVAAKKEIVNARLDVLQGAGLTPTIIDVDSFTMENMLEPLRNPKETGAILCLNLGHMVTNLSIIEKGVTRVVRDIFISGNSMTKGIMKQLQLDFVQAEEAKKKNGIITDAGEKEKLLAAGNKEALGVSQALTTVVKDLVAEVHRSVDFYLSQGPERSIARIVLAGGTARVKNLDKHLSAEVKVPVQVLDPFTIFKDPPKDVPEEVRSSFGVALGLGLRRNRDWL
ncbi:MAG: type IV pilus assembly protein PilM [Elusimicrobia bacterium]|nr:type IV pilus assembly protein PilM [Elusimicrobiota bacterium]